MQNYVRVVSDDTQISRHILSKLMSQVCCFLSESNLLTNSINFSGINIVVNPDQQDFAQAKKINSKLFWSFNTSGIQLSESSFRNFQLRCIHLDIDESISSILLVFMEDLCKNNCNCNNSDDDDAGVKSYLAIEPKYSLEKVVMPDDTKSQIERAIILIKNQHKIFEEWGFSEIDPHTKTILCFYGAPGTGKTMCAHALAREIGKKILIASYASIESKWVGEGPKNLQRIFKDAEEQDAVLFFDEADSFLSKRVNNAETGSDKHYNRMSNEMFQLLEDYNGVIIFATNLVVDFDKAFKSRILAFVEFIKPDYEARKKLISMMIPSKLPMQNSLSDDELDELSTLSAGFSGREMRKAILTTLAEGALRDVSYFSLEEFKAGINAVMGEMQAVEAEIANANVNDCLSDYLKTMEDNQAILNVCLYISNNNKTYNDNTKNALIAIGRILHLETPNFETPPTTEDFISSIKVVIASNRVAECMKYVCSVMATSLLSDDIIDERIDDVCSKFQVLDKRDAYCELVKQFKKLII